MTILSQLFSGVARNATELATAALGATLNETSSAFINGTNPDDTSGGVSPVEGVLIGLAAVGGGSLLLTCLANLCCLSKEERDRGDYICCCLIPVKCIVDTLKACCCPQRVGYIRH